MYGATEASRMSYLPWSKCGSKIGSIEFNTRYKDEIVSQNKEKTEKYYIKEKTFIRLCKFY